MPHVEVHEDEWWEDGRGRDCEPEEPLRRAPRGDRGGHEQERVQAHHVRHRVREDRSPRIGIEPLGNRSEVPLPQVPAGQPLRDRARRLDRVCMPRPERSGDERHGDEDDGPRVDPFPLRGVARLAGLVRERGQDPEGRGRRLHEHPDEARRERRDQEEGSSRVAPQDGRVCEPDRAGRREVLDHRGAAPDERERREREGDHGADAADRPGHVADEPDSSSAVSTKQTRHVSRSAVSSATPMSIGSVASAW